MVMISDYLAHEREQLIYLVSIFSIAAIATHFLVLANRTDLPTRQEKTFLEKYVTILGGRHLESNHYH
jgi:hypothetical protein